MAARLGRGTVTLRDGGQNDRSGGVLTAAGPSRATCESRSERLGRGPNVAPVCSNSHHRRVDVSVATASAAWHVPRDDAAVGEDPNRSGYDARLDGRYGLRSGYLPLVVSPSVRSVCRTTRPAYGTPDDRLAAVRHSFRRTTRRTTGADGAPGPTIVLELEQPCAATGRCRLAALLVARVRQRAPSTRGGRSATRRDVRAVRSDRLSSRFRRRAVTADAGRRGRR
jgi:hypothetical protein